MTLADILTIHVDFRDTEAAARITPEQANAYLAAHGWQRFDDAPWFLWDKGDDEQIAVPRETHWRDYGARMCTLLNDLGRHEDRSPLAVFAEMITVRE